ncbi:MAG: M18 family aminopeptidase, partial [Bacilli bacterium]|nr:M18 family aminopeptidase [Bacilli bacterium]
NQSYTTDSLSGSIIKAVCLNHQLPYQEFTNRSDMRGGSTLGNISNSEVSLLSADIGLPQLAMHSCYEVMGKEDLNIMVQFVKALYESDIMISENEISVH